MDWSNILSGGIGRILDASIRIGNGTFSELVEAVGNSQTCGIYRAGDGYTVEKQIFGTPSFLFDRSLISLDDIVSRDHRFFERYTAVLGRPSKTYPVSALIESGSTHFEILGGLTKTPKEIREVFHLSADLSISRRKNMMSGREIDCMYINFPFIAPGQLIDALLWIYEDEVGHYSSENFRNGDRLSVMLRTFLLSYILGMLVRYFPFRWISLLRNDVGDAAQPLLLSAMEIIEQDFPVLIDKSIWGR